MTGASLLRPGAVLLLPPLLLLLPAGLAAQPRSKSPVDFMAELVARSFFRGVVEGDVETLVPLCAERVSFDGHVAQGPLQVRQQLERMVQRARQGKLHLRRVQVISSGEARARFGPPPGRMAGSVAAGTLVALACFGSGGAVALLGRKGRFWRVVAVTD